MACAMSFETESMVEAAEMAELVRGREQNLLERLARVVTREDVTLDLCGVERIDAAGLAALITLYCDACKAGHSFTVMRPGRHVREVLSLVGLDRILLARDNAQELRLKQSAA